MRIKKFLNPSGPLLRNYVAQNDVTYIPLTKIILKYELPGYITLTDGTKIKPNNTVAEVSPLSNTLPQQQAYYNTVGKEKDKKEKLKLQTKEAERITLGALDAIATLPSRTIGAVKDAKLGNKSFISSMIEGNKGLDNEELNTLINFIGPAAFTKGLKIFPRGVQTAARFAASPYTGKWTLIGNRAYRLKPGLVGMNNILIESKALTNPTPIELIFEQNRWNRFRNPKYVTTADRIELESHFPEYKAIQEKALDEGNYMIVSKDSPLAKLSVPIEDDKLLFTGDEGTFILSLSQDFKAKQGNQMTKVGFKGGTDQKDVSGVVEKHAPETFPLQENGVFFAGDRRYADTYNSGKESPGFWLFFRSPYDMLDGGKRAFPLEDNTVKFVRGVMSNPSYKGGEIPILTYNTINKAWNAEYLNNPEIVEFLSRDPNKMSSSELIKRDNLLKIIRQGQLPENEKRFIRGVESMIKSGKLLPLRSLYYDGFIGRDHALGWSPTKDLKWPFGSNPETYVIFYPELAKLLVGNNGAFSSFSSIYSRKKGGKLNRLIKI